jgi:outer membrane immunogenic protein
MKYLSGLFGLALMSAAASVSATAADVYGSGAIGYKDGPYVPVWTGFYAGGHLGGAWSGIGVFDSFLARDASFRADGVTGGGQLGYNVQQDHVVFGIEVDFGGLDVSGSRSIATQVIPALGPSRWSVSGGFYGDITGRLGYSIDRTLIYAKGGAAFLNLDAKAHVCTDACSDTGGSDTRWGWTAGGGVEHLLSPSWSVKVEYQHFDFGDESFRLNNFKGFFLGTDKFLVSSDAVAAGVNYHFGADSTPLK